MFPRAIFLNEFSNEFNSNNVHNLELKMSVGQTKPYCCWLSISTRAILAQHDLYVNYTDQLLSF